jgi:hypothetical protein
MEQPANIILKAWSGIVLDKPMFWSDMVGHLIILKRDVAMQLVVPVLETKTVTTTKSPKPYAYA